MFDNCPKSCSVASFSDFRDTVLSDRAKSKGEQYIAAPFSSGSHPTDPDKFPGEKGWRVGLYAEPRCWIPMDLDWCSSTEAFEALREACAGVSCFIYTTGSHTSASPRARLIFELTRPVDREEGIKLGKALGAGIAKHLSEHAFDFDANVYRGEQPIYLPLEDAETFVFEGEPLDADKFLQAYQGAPTTTVRSDDFELVEVESDKTDEKVIAEVKRLTKYRHLWNGKWQDEYPSQSQADFALLWRLCGVTCSNEQVSRLFRESVLGQRKKAQRDDYLNRSLRRFRSEQAERDAVKFDPDFVKGPFTSGPDPVGNSALNTVPSPPSITLPRVKIADLTPDVQLPPQEEVVSKHLPVGVPTLLAAHGGAGKSMLGLQLAACVASGREFMGLSTMRVPVTIYSAEDSTLDLRHRLKRIFTYYNINPKTVADSLDVRDVTDINSALYVEHSVSGVRSGTTTHVYNALLDACELNNSRLVIIDNASDVFEANENDRTLVRGFMRSLGQLARVIDGAVLLLAHVNKVTAMNGSRSEGYSGSTAWHNSARSRLALTEAEGGLTLSHEKANRGERCHDIALNWTSEGLLVPGHVQYDGERDGPDLEQLLAMIQEHTERGDPVSTSRTNGNAFSVLSPLDGFPVGMKRNRFLRLMDRAEQDGRLRRIVHTTAQRKKRDIFEVVEKV